MLALEADGTAVVDRHARSGHTQRRGTVAPAALARLDAALVESGFPEHPRPLFVVPDSAICTLEVEREGETERLSGAVRDLRPVPGYAELLDALDELVSTIATP